MGCLSLFINACQSGKSYGNLRIQHEGDFLLFKCVYKSNVEIFNNVCSLQCKHMLSLEEKAYYCTLSERIVDDSALDAYLLKGCEHLNNQSLSVGRLQ